MFAKTLTATLRVTGSASYVMRTANTAATRSGALAQAVENVEKAVAAGPLRDAQSALKTALEAIHELADCLGRGEWVRSGWSVDDVGEWVAHIGARNMAHHSSFSVAALHSAAKLDDRLRWEIDPQAVATLHAKHSKTQACEYRARLDGQAVLPALRALAARVSTAVR
jgi:hypothetical protein